MAPARCSRQNCHFLLAILQGSTQEATVKLEQGIDKQANSVMVQKQFNDMALKITQLERFTDDQKKNLSDVINKVNDKASRSDRSIPGVINTSGTPSTSNSSELATV